MKKAILETYQEKLKKKLIKSGLTTRWLYLQLGYTDTNRVSFWRKVKNDTLEKSEKKQIEKLLTK